MARKKPRTEQDAKPQDAGSDAASEPAVESARPVEPAPVEEPQVEYVYTTRWYWISLAIALFSLGLALFYFDPTLPPFFIWAFYFVIVVSAILVVYTAVGLMRRYRLIHSLGRGSRDLARRSGAALGTIRNRGAGVGAGSMGAAGKAMGGFGRGILNFFLFLYRFVMRIVYFVEWLVVWVIILTYDLIYGVLYAAWWVSFHVLRIAGKIVAWALRVVWAVLKVFTKLPGIKGLWADKMRPVILHKWHTGIERRRTKWRTSVERRKRLVAAKGGDAEQWHREKIARHWFPLPLPHVAKDALKRRLEHAASTKDRRVERGPFRSAEERDEARKARLAAKEEKQKAKDEKEAARERAKAEKERAKLEAKREKKKAKESEADEDSPKKGKRGDDE